MVDRSVDYDYVVHHADDDHGLLVVRDVPAQVCVACDEYWFEDSIGLGLARLLDDHRPGPGQIRTIVWSRADAA